MFTHSHLWGPLFWIIMGALYLLFFTGFRYFAEDKGIRMTWWKWLLMAVWFALTSLTIAGGFTLIGENEARAGLMFTALFGTLCIILGVGLWRLIKLK